MERNAEKRRPKTNSPSKRNDLVSGAKARFDASVRRTREFFVSLRSAVPPLRDIVILVALTVIAFASGFFVGRGTTQPALPGDFVSIQEIDIHGTSSHLADVTGTEDVIPQDIATYQTADGEPTGGNEDGVTLKGKEATASTVPEKDTGVVGPVPAETPEVKSEVRPRESAVPTKEKMIMPAQGRVVSDFGWRKHPVYQDWRYHTGVGSTSRPSESCHPSQGISSSCHSLRFQCLNTERRRHFSSYYPFYILFQLHVADFV
jgi:murein DD-endopeptidase MepM/ murein hydrolase activator NlpD